MANAPPSFDNMVNDLTGTSVTVTVTPPTDVGYVQTESYYRRMSNPNGLPDLTWQAGASHVGVPGVQSTFQVTGLEADQLYEVILYADYGAGFSPPSITRRVVVTSDGIPVPERILHDVASWIRSISVADGYNYDIRDVKIIRSAGTANLDEYPGAIVYGQYDNYNDRRPVGMITKHLKVNVEGWIAAYEDANVLDYLELFIADLETAILAGRRRSGQAVTTSIEQVMRVTTDEGVPFGGVIFNIDIHYRTDFGNPYKRR
jgi:hypothetical protein